MTTHNRSTHPSSFTNIEILTCRHERRANQVRGNRTSPYYSRPVLSFCFTRSPSSFSTFFLSSLLNLPYSFSSPFLSYFSFLHLYFILPLTFLLSTSLPCLSSASPIFLSSRNCWVCLFPISTALIDLFYRFVPSFPFFFSPFFISCLQEIRCITKVEYIKSYSIYLITIPFYFFFFWCSILWHWLIDL